MSRVFWFCFPLFLLMHLVSFALSVQIYCRCVFWLTSSFKEETENHSKDGKEAMKGGCISKQETHTIVSHTGSNAHTFRHRTHWCVAVVAALVHVSMLWLQSLASFAEDHGRSKVTAFLDRAASLCPFLAVSLVCQCVFRQGECVSEAFAELPDRAGSSVHLIDCLFAILSLLQLLYVLAFHCHISPLISFFLSHCLFLFFWKLSFVVSRPLLLFHCLLDLFSHLNACKFLHRRYQQHRKPLFPSIWWQEERLQMWTALSVPPSLSLFFLFSFH